MNATLRNQINAAPRDTLLAILANIGATVARSTKRDMAASLIRILERAPGSESANATRGHVISRMLHNGFTLAADL